MDSERVGKTCEMCGVAIIEAWEPGPVNEECYRCNSRMYLPKIEPAVCEGETRA